MGKKSVVKETKQLIQQMRKDLEKVKDFNLEEFKGAFIEFAGFMFEVQVGMVESGKRTGISL